MPRPKPTVTDFDLLTVQQACHLLACSRRTFQRARAVGLVPAATPTLGGDRWPRFELTEVQQEFARNAAKWRKRLAARQKAEAAAKAAASAPNT